MTKTWKLYFFYNLFRYLTINKLTMKKIIFLLTILIAAI